MYLTAIDTLRKRTIQLEIDAFFIEPDTYVVEGINEGEHARLSTERYLIVSIKDERKKDTTITHFSEL